MVRETFEEVGVTVGDVTYWGSQPWPFPHSLMVGFRARYVAGEFVLQADEIAEAGWFAPRRAADGAADDEHRRPHDRGVGRRPLNGFRHRLTGRGRG